MKMNDLTPGQQKIVKKELDSNNKEGTLYLIIQYIKAEFGDEGTWYALDSEGLQILAERLYKIENLLTECYSCGETNYFKFNQDICDVFDIIRHNITNEVIPKENEPILVVHSDLIIYTIENEAEEYLNKKEDTNE